MNVILFKEDWDKYPSAVVHWETKNESWIKHYKLLERMGVANNKFHLALINPALRDVDPWDENLPQNIKLQILLEIKVNPWYYFREIARFNVSVKRGRKHLRANRGNIAAWWLFFNHQDYNLTQPRQTGKSTSSNWLVTWLLFFIYSGTDLFLLTKDAKLRERNVSAIKQYRDLIPEYLNISNKQDVNNSVAISCVKRENKLYTAVSQKANADADKIGRGFTCKVYIVDEGPYVNHLKTSLTAMLAGGTDARQQAEDAGEPYGNIFTTTAGSRADESGKHYYKMLMAGVTWTERFLDCDNTQQLNAIIEKSCGDKKIINITLSHRQLGYSDEWLLNTMRTVGSDESSANKDYFNIWDDGSIESPISKEVATMLRSRERDPDYVEFTKDSYMINWYIPKDQVPRRLSIGKYIIGLDTSDAIGEDGLSFHVTDSSTLETIGSMVIKNTNLLVYGEWLLEFMVKYKNTILIPERKSSAAGIIDLLLLKLPIYGEDPFKRIFNTIVHNGKHRDSEFRDTVNGLKNNSVSTYNSVKKYFGFNTAGGEGEFSRTNLYKQVLMLACDYAGPVLYDKATVAEILGLTRRNGRIDHTTSGHDDRVISFLLTIWMLSQGRNLDYYGIENPMGMAIDWKTRLKVLSGESTVGAEVYDSSKQKKIKAEIDELLELVKSTRDELLSLQYESKLRILDQRYKGQEFGMLSITELIATAKSEKAKKLKQRNSNRGLLRRQ